MANLLRLSACLFVLLSFNAFAVKNSVIKNETNPEVLEHQNVL